MKVLAIDTTTKDMMVAVITENEIFDASALNLGTHHSEMLCGAVADVLKKANVTFADLDAYACAIGPGSFTGIRIGVSTVKGYATACPKRYIAVNCLQAIGESDKLGATGAGFIDAGNGYYYADFANDVRPCLVSYEFADEHKNVPVAALASEYFDGFVNIVRKRFAKADFDEELTPLYIRKSQAEERR